MTACTVVGVEFDLEGDVAGLPTSSFGNLILSATWKWGAQNPLGPLTVPQAGGATIRLIDTLRWFDPLNTDTPVDFETFAGTEMVITADAAPAFTGYVDSWSHDQATHVSTLQLIDAVGRAGGMLGPDDAILLPTVPGTGPPEVTALTPRDVAEAILDGFGWPADKRQWLGSSWGAVDPFIDEIEATSNLLAELARWQLADQAQLGASRDGSLRWIGPVWVDPPAVSAVVNCGGVLLDSMEGAVISSRIRNEVRFNGVPSSGEWSTPSATFSYGVSDARRPWVASVDDLALAGPAAVPIGEGADGDELKAVLAGLVVEDADAYQAELYDEDLALLWASGTVAIIPDLGYGNTSAAIAHGITLTTGARYYYRVRFRHTTAATFTPWLGGSFTQGTRALTTPPYGFAYYAETILGALGAPRPLPILGTMAPFGPAEVASILLAELGDRWTVNHEHVDPAIEVEVRVLGMSVRLEQAILEVDAVTEDVAPGAGLDFLVDALGNRLVTADGDSLYSAAVA